MELLLPRSCGGCQAPGSRLCAVCRQSWRSPPSRISCDVDFPVWSLGPYQGAHRGVLIAMKERGRRDLFKDIGAVLEASISYLIARGEVEHNVVLVPAPTRPRSRRLRGGDPVAEVCKNTCFSTFPCVALPNKTPDSVGLSLEERRRNLKVELLFTPPSPVLLVDDVITSGATLTATAHVLRSAGCTIRGSLTYCHA